MKTIRYTDQFRLSENGCFLEQLVYDETDPARENMIWMKTWIRVGARCTLGSKTDVSPDAIRNGRNVARYFLVRGTDGIGGNLDPKNKQVSGWRGTTDNVSVYAHGLVTVRKIRELKNGEIAVSVS